MSEAHASRIMEEFGGTGRRAVTVEPPAVPPPKAAPLMSAAERRRQVSERMKETNDRNKVNDSHEKHLKSLEFPTLEPTSKDRVAEWIEAEDERMSHTCELCNKNYFSLSNLVLCTECGVSRRNWTPERAEKLQQVNSKHYEHLIQIQRID